MGLVEDYQARLNQLVQENTVAQQAKDAALATYQEAYQRLSPQQQRGLMTAATAAASPLVMGPLGFAATGALLTAQSKQDEVRAFQFQNSIKIQSLAYEPDNANPYNRQFTGGTYGNQERETYREEYNPATGQMVNRPYQTGQPRAWWDYQISERERQAKANTAQSSPASSQKDYLNRPGLTKESDLGDSRTQAIRKASEMAAMITGRGRALSTGEVLEAQRQSSLVGGQETRASRYYGNELQKYMQNYVEVSSAYHHAALDTGLPQGPNPYELAGDLGLITLKGSQEVDKGQLGRISPMYGQFGASLPHPEGLQGYYWDVGLNTDRPEKYGRPGLVSFMPQIQAVDAAVGVLGPYTTAGESRSYNTAGVPAGQSYRWNVGEQQRIAMGGILSPADQVRFYYDTKGISESGPYIETTRYGAQQIEKGMQKAAFGSAMMGSIIGIEKQRGAFADESGQPKPFVSSAAAGAGILAGIGAWYEGAERGASQFFAGVRAQDTVGQWGMGGEEYWNKLYAGKPISQRSPIEGLAIGAVEDVRGRPINTMVSAASVWGLGYGYEALGLAGARAAAATSLSTRAPSMYRAGRIAYSTVLPAAMVGLYGLSVGARALEPDEMGNISGGAIGTNIGNMSTEFLGVGLGVATYPGLAVSTNAARRGAGHVGTQMTRPIRAIEIDYLAAKQEGLVTGFPDYVSGKALKPYRMQKIDYQTFQQEGGGGFGAYAGEKMLRPIRKTEIGIKSFLQERFTTPRDVAPINIADYTVGWKRGESPRVVPAREIWKAKLPETKPSGTDIKTYSGGGVLLSRSEMPQMMSSQELLGTPKFENPAPALYPRGRYRIIEEEEFISPLAPIPKELRQRTLTTQTLAGISGIRSSQTTMQMSRTMQKQAQQLRQGLLQVPRQRGEQVSGRVSSLLSIPAVESLRAISPSQIFGQASRSISGQIQGQRKIQIQVPRQDIIPRQITRPKLGTGTIPGLGSMSGWGGSGWGKLPRGYKYQRITPVAMSNIINIGGEIRTRRRKR